MEEELELTPTLKMLLANTGSMTVLLEALFGEIKIETEMQEETTAGPELVKLLDIKEGDVVNHRVVRLLANRPLVRAASYAPLSRLNEKVKDDILKKDIPIGRIMEKHSIESLRLILGYDWFQAGPALATMFELNPDSVLLKREYNIIHRRKPLIHISEVFPIELIRWKK
jgi:beta-ribofuranosylaminobenzene 5'-phosphate synthase